MVVEDILNLLLCAPLLALYAAEEVGIYNVGFVCGVVVAVIEHTLQALDKVFLAAHEFCESGKVMRHCECVAPCRCLVEAGHVLEVLSGGRVKVAKELALFGERTQCAVLLAEVAAVAL